MAKITVECTDPNDMKAMEVAMEQVVGKCNITYAKQAQALQEVGTASSQRDAARIIAEDTGESAQAVRHRIMRGKNEMVQGGPPTAEPSETPMYEGAQESTPKIEDLRINKENIAATVASMMEECKTQRAVFLKLADETGLSVAAIGGRYQRAINPSRPKKKKADGYLVPLRCEDCAEREKCSAASDHPKEKIDREECFVAKVIGEEEAAALGVKPSFEVAMRYAKMAVADLEQIRNYHHDWKEALAYVNKWIAKTRKELS